jgi:hypothetical protein
MGRARKHRVTQIIGGNKAQSAIGGKIPDSAIPGAQRNLCPGADRKRLTIDAFFPEVQKKGFCLTFSFPQLVIAHKDIGRGRPGH